jgi:hypothetical protein
MARLPNNLGLQSGMTCIALTLQVINVFAFAVVDEDCCMPHPHPDRPLCTSTTESLSTVVSGKKSWKNTQLHVGSLASMRTSYGQPKITSIQLLHTPSRLSASQKWMPSCIATGRNTQISESFRRFVCLPRLRGKLSKPSANTCEQFPLRLGLLQVSVSQ